MREPLFIVVVGLGIASFMILIGTLMFIVSKDYQ